MNKTKINQLIAKSVTEMETMYDAKLTEREIEIFALGISMGARILSGSCEALVKSLTQFEGLS